MSLLLALLLPLAVFLGLLGVVVGGRVGHILVIAATILGGFAVLLVLVGT